MHFFYSQFHSDRNELHQKTICLERFQCCFFIHLANIRRILISLSLRCCIIDILYGFKWRSNLKILCTLVLRQVTLLLTWLKTFLTDFWGVSSISFLTSCIASGFLTDRGLPLLECLVSCVDPVFSNLLTIRRIYCLLTCFNTGYSFCIILITLTGDCVL